MLTDEEIKQHNWTLEEVENEIKQVYLLVDDGIIPLLCATVISNRIKSQQAPVWLLIMAGSSGGKSIMLNLFTKCGDWITSIDTLTTNTFASGLARDTETSLLHKLKNGIMLFKDFTVLTTMNEETLREIMGQLRAIFDGSFNKKTGNNVDVNWNGKIGCIAAGTPEVQRKMRIFAQQGERFLNYIISTADSKEMTKRAMDNQGTIKTKEEYLQKIMATFINQTIVNMTISEFQIDPVLRDELIDVADFCTLARSPVIMNRRDETLVEFVPSREEPMRMATMLKNMAVALIAQRGEKELNQKNAAILYKIALDSIPVERRLCLKILSEYKNSNTKSIAVKLRYDSNIVTGWLNQLNALKLVSKIKEGNSFVWQIKDEYKKIMIKYLDLKEEDVPLFLEDEFEVLIEKENAYTEDNIKKFNEAANSIDLGDDDEREIAQQGFNGF